MNIIKYFRFYLIILLPSVASVAMGQQVRPYGENLFIVEDVRTEYSDGSIESDQLANYFAFIAQEDDLICMLKRDYESDIMEDVIYFDKGKGYYVLGLDDNGEMVKCLLYSLDFPDRILILEYFENSKIWSVNFVHFINTNGYNSIDFITQVLLEQESGASLPDFILNQIDDLNFTYQSDFLRKYTNITIPRNYLH